MASRRDRQADYYRILAVCDKAANSTAFIEFMLDSLLAALRESSVTDQVSDQLTDQVKALLQTLAKAATPLSTADCLKRLKLSHRPTFRQNYLNLAIEAGLVEPTIPDKPNSRLQKYRLTPAGIALTRS